MAQNYKNAFLTNITTLPSSGDTLTLGDSQIGVFNATTYQAVLTPSYPSVTEIIIAQGRDAMTFPMGSGLTNETPKSPRIAAQSIVKWEAKKSQRPQNMIVTLGFDGVDTSKTLSLPVDKDVKFFLTLSGQPIGNIFGAGSTTHYTTLTEEFTPILPCLNDCTDNCGDLVDCNTIADAIIDVVNKRKIVGGQELSKYVRVSKVLSCDTPSGYPTTNCVKWSLTICDLGTMTALGAVQAQYPGVTITRTARVGSLSTYELILCDGSTPAAYDLTVTPVIPNCATCPSGYTLTDELYAYIVTRTDLGNAAALSTFETDYTATAEEATAVRLSYALGTSTYQIFATTSTLAAAVDGDVVTSIGTVQGICTIDTATTSAWTEGTTCTKAQKTFQISLKNDACGDGFLTELQAAYEGIGTVTQGETNSDNCTTIYYIVINSNNVACDDCNEPGYTFSVPQPFNQSIWTETSMIVNGTGCVCGVKFESAYVQRERKECYFTSVSYEVEPLFISISSKNPNDRDYSELCHSDFPVTVVQGVKYAAGFGSSVVSERVKQSNFYFNRPWKGDPAERDAMGYELGVDLQGYYDEYVLVFTAPMPEGNTMSQFGRTQLEQYEYHIYFPEGGGSEFETAINAFVSFPGSTILPITI
jgi:hypothetical protein